MKKDELLTLTIEGTAQDGRGIARFDGFVVFVHGAAEGDTVTARVYTVHKTYATAGVVTLLKQSPLRQAPFCDNATECGGCPLSHIAYEHQLRVKKQTVQNALCRLGGFAEECFVLQDTVGMEVPFRYRNKMVFPLAFENGKTVGGFYAPKSHRVIALSDCMSGETAAATALKTVVDFCNANGVLPYDEGTNRGTLRRVFVRTGFHTKELMVVLSSFTEKVPKLSLLVNALAAADFGDYTLKSVILNINNRKNNLVLGDKNVTLLGQSTIQDTLMGLSFSVSPHSFFQVNPLQTERLYQTALQLAELDKTQNVLDIYCGIGTISLCAAKRAKKVVGIEIVPSATKDAEKNAKENGVNNAEFFCGAAEDVTPRLIAQGFTPHTVIIDPPRKGSDEKTLSAILNANPERIVYVSCNPATLARDAKFLCSSGTYQLVRAIPVDMFPHTEHVETVVLLSQLKPDDVIQVELNSEDLALTSTEAKATYEEIKTFVKRVFGFKVSSLYIAQVKRKYGIEVGQNYNISKKGTPVPVCPKDKEKAIVTALKHYRMIK